MGNKINNQDSTNLNMTVSLIRLFQNQSVSHYVIVFNCKNYAQCRSLTNQNTPYNSILIFKTELLYHIKLIIQIAEHNYLKPSHMILYNSIQSTIRTPLEHHWNITGILKEIYSVVKKIGYSPPSSLNVHLQGKRKPFLLFFFEDYSPLPCQIHRNIYVLHSKFPHPSLCTPYRRILYSLSSCL